MKCFLSEIKSLKKYIISIILVLILSYSFLNFSPDNIINDWGKEDGFFEWLTALCYFISFLLLAVIYKKNKNIFILLLGIVMLFGAGEELSWGQRIFGFATPEAVDQVNVQHEFNLHNTVLFDSRHLDMKLKTGVEKLFEMNFLLKLFFACFGILLPICIYHVKLISNFIYKLKVPVPPISLGLFFSISWFLMKFSLISYRPESSVSRAGSEIAEFIGSYIMAIISLYFYNYNKFNIMGKNFKQLKSED